MNTISACGDWTCTQSPCQEFNGLSKRDWLIENTWQSYGSLLVTIFGCLLVQSLNPFETCLNFQVKPFSGFRDIICTLTLTLVSKCKNKNNSVMLECWVLISDWKTCMMFQVNIVSSLVESRNFMQKLNQINTKMSKVEGSS